MRRLLGRPADNREKRAWLLNKLTGSVKINAVDVGGANGFQPHWSRMYDNLHALIFEPGEESYKQLEITYRDKVLASDFILSQDALSETGGPRTLYLTNVPTGSSLLRPNRDSAFVANSSYFFPLREISVQTGTLTAALAKYNFPQPDIIKLDVQGLEYAIIKSMPQRLLQNICLYELEINLLDAYEGQTPFSEYLRFFDDLGYQLLDLRTNRGSIPVDGGLDHFEKVLGSESRANPAVAVRLLETDAIFIPKYEKILQSYSTEQIRKLIAILCVYNFFHEALLLTHMLLNAEMISAADQAMMNSHIETLYSIMRKELKHYERQLRLNQGHVWAQYMEVPYPSF